MNKLTKEKVVHWAQDKKVRTADLAARFGVSRQYANVVVNALLAEGKLIKVGSTRNAFYLLPEVAEQKPELLSTRFGKWYAIKDLEEHHVLAEIKQKLSFEHSLPENIQSIFTFAFSEMLNNAIEHSESDRVHVLVAVEHGVLRFVVDDGGVGVFRSVKQKKHLPSELEAIRELLKGKVTTMPQSHSGEGIFFTSRVADEFALSSYGYQLVVKNQLPDVFAGQDAKQKQGTAVTFILAVDSRRHLQDIFKEYTSLNEDSDYGFDKTEIRVRLYTQGGVHVSRSQARRILAGLEKFSVIVFDYDRVPMIGQAFADEIYRVFHSAYPAIRIQEENANDAVQFMIERAKTEASRR